MRLLSTPRAVRIGVVHHPFIPVRTYVQNLLEHASPILLSHGSYRLPAVWSDASTVDFLSILFFFFQKVLGTYLVVHSIEPLYYFVNQNCPHKWRGYNISLSFIINLVTFFPRKYNMCISSTFQNLNLWLYGYYNATAFADDLIPPHSFLLCFILGEITSDDLFWSLISN
jgi:hypothetical protein